MSGEQALEKMDSDLDRFTEYVQFLRHRCNKDELYRLCSLRGFSRDLVDKHDIFWVGHMREMLVPDFLDDLTDFGIISNTNNMPIYHDRWIIPIKNDKGQVVNLVGYSNIEQERYVYGTGKYYSRTDTFFGLENIADAYEKGWSIITEGITDTLSIRDLGYKNAFAWCGTMKSRHKITVLNRMCHGNIFIHDRDKAGDRTRSHWQTNRYFRFNTPIKYKDADATLHDPEQDNTAWFKECMDIAVQWIESAEHNGNKCACESATMI